MTTLFDAFRNKDANNLRNALAVAESNRTADLTVGTEFANRLNNCLLYTSPSPRDP